MGTLVSDAPAAFPGTVSAQGSAGVNREHSFRGVDIGSPGRLAYTVAKSGILGMTRSLAVEWGHHGLRVNAMAPGYVDTEMIRSGSREGTLNEAELLRRTPLGRLAQADDIASAIALLLGHDSHFVRGVTLKVDGGSPSMGHSTDF